MRAGKLRTPVIFQEQEKAADDGGGHTLSWSGDRVVFCEFRTQNARESLQAGRVEDTATAVLSTRYHSVSFLDPSWRVLIDDVLWNILSVTPDDQRKGTMNIVIERGVAT